jgi:hypothetical protein
MIMTGNEAARDRNRLTSWTFVYPADRDKIRNATTAQQKKRTSRP